MGLVSKTVKVKWCPSNKKHYESLGYIYTKMGDEFKVSIEDLSKGSSAKVSCSCDNCKKDLYWKYDTYNRYVKEDGKTYCQKCAKKLYGKTKEIKTRLLKGKSFYDWCIENNRQDILDRWDYELNNCSPKDVLYATNKKYWFKCNRHPEHKSELKRINGFTRSGQEGSIKCKQCNSIAQYILDSFSNKKLEEVWDYEKNGDLDPWEISKGSGKKVWIICQEKDYHGSYETTPDMLSRGVRCPYCNKNGGKVHPLDSLGQYVIDNYGKEFLWVAWSDKNEITPFEVSIYSRKKVWWNCPDNKHEPFERSCSNSINLEFRCPECVKEKEESVLEEKTKIYLEELGYEVKTEHNCTIRPNSPKNNHPLPFDNEIILSNGKHLIVEVHGEQHYKLLSKNHRYLKEEQTPEEYLHQRKLYDRYKRIKCIQAGYEYLEIPYTAFNKKETYKKLINNKIKNILDK